MFFTTDYGYPPSDTWRYKRRYGGYTDNQLNSLADKGFSEFVRIRKGPALRTGNDQEMRYDAH